MWGKGPNYYGEAHGLLTVYYTTYTQYYFLSSIHISLAYYIIYAAAYNTFFDSQLLCCSHLNRKVAQQSFLWANSVIKLCHQSLAFSTFIVLSRQLGTLKKTRLNYDVNDLQVRALERGQRSQLGILNQMTVKRVFSQSECVFFQVPSCLDLTEV